MSTHDEVKNKEKNQDNTQSSREAPRVHTRFKERGRGVINQHGDKQPLSPEEEKHRGILN